IFTPNKPALQLGADTAPGFARQRIDLVTQLSAGGRLQIVPVGGEHGAEGVGGDQYDFRQRTAAPGCDFGPQDLFQLVGQLAELAVAASRGISFQGVHRAPHLAKKLFILRMLLQLQALVIEGLQQLRSALKEELAELGSAVIWKEAQTVTSSRWY